MFLLMFRADIDGAAPLRPRTRRIGTVQVVMLQRLTPLQLRAVFDVFDADADGECTREEVAAGLKLMGVQVDAAALEQTMTSILSASFDDDATPPNSVNFQMFSDWWQMQVKTETSRKRASRPVVQTNGWRSPHPVTWWSSRWTRTAEYHLLEIDS